MPKWGVSASPYPVVDDVGVVKSLIEGFVEPLREPLAMFELVRGKENRYGHWGQETIEWRESDDLGPTVFSMDFPEIRSDSGRHRKRRVEMGMFTKDLQMGGRKWRQWQEVPGAAALETPGLSREMARDLNYFIGFGTVDTPAEGVTEEPIKGLLNQDGIVEVTGGDWSKPKVLNRDLGAASAGIRSRRYGGNHTMLMNGHDEDVFIEFIGETNFRIGENLPGSVSRILYDELVDPGEAYLVNDAPGAYEVVFPFDEQGYTFGLGNISVGTQSHDDQFNPLAMTGTTQEDLDEFMYSRTIRFLNMMTLRLIRTGEGKGGAPVARIEFEKGEESS